MIAIGAHETALTRRCLAIMKSENMNKLAPVMANRFVVAYAAQTIAEIATAYAITGMVRLGRELAGGSGGVAAAGRE